MTIVQLQYILAVYKYKNFTTAAENCFVTQPTLSMQIQKLEDELGVEIFDRSAHPIQATKIGLQLIEQAKNIVEESKKIKSIIQEEKGTLEGEFTIGVIPTIFPGLIPLFLKTYIKKYPEIKLTIKELQTKEIIKALKDGQIDIGIAVSPIHEDFLSETPLYEEPFVAYIPENHRLTQKSILTPKDLEFNDMLLLSEGNCFRNNVIDICNYNREETDKRVSFDSGNLDVLVKLSREGFGMTLLPLIYANELNENDTSRIKYFIEPSPYREISLIYHKSMLRLTFINSLQEVIQSIMRGYNTTEISTKPNSPQITISK